MPSSPDPSWHDISMRPALRITLIYALVGALWIIVSDMLMVSLAGSGSFAERISIAKGWFFIIATSLMLFWLISSYLKRLRLRALALTQSEQKAQQLAETRRLLLRELDHRVKNNLGSLFSLMSLYADHTRDVTVLADQMRGKIMALKRAHEIMAAGEWRVIDVTDLILAVAEPMVPLDQTQNRLRIEGSKLQIGPRQASSLAMLLHEMFVNSKVHGSLSSPQGRIVISIQIQQQNQTNMQTQITWQESEGFIVQPTIHRGVGMGLIEGISRFELGGDCRFDFQPSGLSCTINALLDMPVAADSSDIQR